MGMRIVGRLKGKQVSNAKPPKGRDSALIPDGGGLFLQLTKNKDGGVRRSWTFKYQLDGQRHELGLSALHTRGLAEAREEAKRLRLLLADGLDPLTEKRKAKQARIAEQAKIVTFEDCAEAYLKAHGDSWKNAKHREQWYSTLETYVYPKIGGMSVADIDVDDVIRCVEPIWRDKPETASRVRGRIESILGYATVRKFRSGDNPARWRGHLAAALWRRARVHGRAARSRLTQRQGIRIHDPLRRKNGRDNRRGLSRDRSEAQGVDDPGQPHEGRKGAHSSPVRPGRRDPEVPQAP
jgi:hypothetical protein